jgi:hypothetical protein
MDVKRLSDLRTSVVERRRLERGSYGGFELSALGANDGDLRRIDDRREAGSRRRGLRVDAVALDRLHHCVHGNMARARQRVQCGQHDRMPIDLEEAAQRLTDLVALTAFAFRRRRATAAEILVLRRQIVLPRARNQAAAN